MRIFRLAFVFAILLANSRTNGQIEKIWETPAELTTCESVCFYPEGNYLFVSCINGNPTEKDGNGFIAKISMNGKILKKDWITGLNAPKGMGIYGDYLFVTDITEIVRISISEEKINQTFPVENSLFLNDITIDQQGVVYISDMMTGKIHILENSTVRTADFGKLEKPNGLDWQQGMLCIGTANGIYKSDPGTGEIQMFIENTGSIDGLESDGNGGFIISDWQGKVQSVYPGKEPVTLLNTTDKGINAADIEYIPVETLLLIPTFFHNTVSCYTVK